MGSLYMDHWLTLPHMIFRKGTCFQIKSRKVWEFRDVAKLWKRIGGTWPNWASFCWWNEAQKIWRSTAHQIPWVVDSLIQPWDLIIFIRARSKHIPNDSNKTGGLQILWNWIVSQVGPFWCHVHFSRSWHQRITLYTPPICSLLRRFIRVLIQDPGGYRWKGGQNKFMRIRMRIRMRRRSCVIATITMSVIAIVVVVVAVIVISSSSSSSVVS